MGLARPPAVPQGQVPQADPVTCPTGKLPYPTWKRAEKTARSLRQRRGGNASPYWCGSCGHLHVGSSTGGSAAYSRAFRARRREIEEKQSWL